MSLHQTNTSIQLFLGEPDEPARKKKKKKKRADYFFIYNFFFKDCEKDFSCDHGRICRFSNAFMISVTVGSCGGCGLALFLLVV